MSIKLTEDAQELYQLRERVQKLSDLLRGEEARYQDLFDQLVILRDLLRRVEKERNELRRLVQIKLPCGHPGACALPPDDDNIVRCGWCVSKASSRREPI